MLDKFPVWKEYKDQKHDLFLNDRPVSGYLTGPVSFYRLKIANYTNLYQFNRVSLAFGKASNSQKTSLQQ